MVDAKCKLNLLIKDKGDDAYQILFFKISAKK